jgi:hypothetical protein
MQYTSISDPGRQQQAPARRLAASVNEFEPLHPLLSLFYGGLVNPGTASDYGAARSVTNRAGPGGSATQMLQEPLARRSACRVKVGDVSIEVPAFQRHQLLRMKRPLISGQGFIGDR